ncbi:ribose-phosphate pyrophosphokinase [Metamycoplasma sualvi]|uniref:ribose-phosphate pyrophosphokinase n=1 Tax=Metamycoplasma sualvi TaxID=2125 RepID=UPI0038732845
MSLRNHKDKSILFGLENQRELAQKVANNLKIKVSNISKTIFSDGEMLVKSSETVRNKKVYVICSLCSHDSIIELLLFIDSLKRASAGNIVVISTYMSYSRQDRKASQREPIGAKLIARLLETSGVNKLITFDLHNPSIQGFYDIPVDDLRWMYPLTQSLLKEEKKMKFTIVSPDHGGAVRARRLAELITKEIKIAIVDKRRTGPNVSEIVGLLGDVKDKNCIIYDDIIDTGGTIIKAANYLKEKGAKKIYIAATHGLFSKGFDIFEKAESVDLVCVSDSIPTVKNIKSKKLKIISLENMISKAIDVDWNSESMSRLFETKKIK